MARGINSAISARPLLLKPVLSLAGLRAPATYLVDRLAGRISRQVGKRLDEHLERLDERLDRRIDARLDERLRPLQPPLGAPGGSIDSRRLRASPKALRGGEKLRTYLIELCRLQPTQAVLEVGCGGGGPALALTGYLDPDARYEGLDIQYEKINRCTEIITARYPNFHFQVADVYNGNYNPRGTYTPSTYRFPFQDGIFDVVLLGSVFTHMLPEDVANYLAEISRVMRPKGRCLITYFLLNPETIQRMEKRAAHKIFGHDFGSYRAEHREHPERAVALPEDFIRTLYGKYGLEILEPVHYGRWSGRKQALSGQDIVVAEKR